MNQNTFQLNFDQDEIVNMYLTSIKEVFSVSMNRDINQETSSINMSQAIKIKTSSSTMNHNIDQKFLSPLYMHLAFEEAFSVMNRDINLETSPSNMDQNIDQKILSPLHMDLAIKQEPVSPSSPEIYQSIKLETFSPVTYQNMVYTDIKLESPIEQDLPCTYLPQDYDIAQAYDPSVFTDVYDFDMHAQQLAQFNALERNPALF